MGKASALRRGIVKGVQHVANPYKAYKELKASAILSVLHCLECGHASKCHTRRRKEYGPMPREQLAKLIQETGFSGSRGFQECIFYHCDQCEHDEYLSSEGHHDKDSCNDKHEEVQHERELKGCSI